MNFFRVRQKVSALYNQAEVDLEEFKGYGTSDKGTEAGVFGIDGLSRARSSPPSAETRSTAGWTRRALPA